MTAPRRLARALAALLALATVLLAVRAWSWRIELAPEEVLAARLGQSLVALQGADGAFDPYPEDPEMPQVRRTGPHALATYALLRLEATRAASAVPGLAEAGRRGLAVLLARQQPGGTFGGLPPGVGNPWPAVEATAEGLLALEAGARPEDRAALLGAAAALVRAAEYGFRDGWTRAIGALALDAAARADALAPAGGNLAALLPLAEALDRIDCGDYALAEGIAATVRGGGDALAGRILGACAARPPTWDGHTSDPLGWWLAAWLAARHPAAGGPVLEGVAAAVRAAVEAPPEGRIPGGWFADEVTQTAAGLLALLEGLDARSGN